MSNWNKKLEKALGDKGKTSQVISDIRNANLSQKELNDLSKEFYGAPAKSKSAAYHNFGSRQRSLDDAKARVRATGGRSAG